MTSEEYIILLAKDIHSLKRGCVVVATVHKSFRYKT